LIGRGNTETARRGGERKRQSTSPPSSAGVFLSESVKGEQKKNLFVRSAVHVEVKGVKPVKSRLTARRWGVVGGGGGDRSSSPKISWTKRKEARTNFRAAIRRERGGGGSLRTPVGIPEGDRTSREWTFFGV